MYYMHISFCVDLHAIRCIWLLCSEWKISYNPDSTCWVILWWFLAVCGLVISGLAFAGFTFLFFVGASVWVASFTGAVWFSHYNRINKRFFVRIRNNDDENGEIANSAKGYFCCPDLFEILLLSFNDFMYVCVCVCVCVCVYVCVVQLANLFWRWPFPFVVTLAITG